MCSNPTPYAGWHPRSMGPVHQIGGTQWEAVFSHVRYAGGSCLPQMRFAGNAARASNGTVGRAYLTRAINNANEARTNGAITSVTNRQDRDSGCRRFDPGIPDLPAMVDIAKLLRQHKRNGDLQVTCCPDYPHICQRCERVMSHREHEEQGICSDCMDEITNEPGPPF